MTKLSVNVNKIATLRNTRANNIPDLLDLAQVALDAGADGITIHPRPDERHIRAADVVPLARLVRGYRDIELNIEGNPLHGQFIEHCLAVRPDQATLVPDTIAQSTSDHGWNLVRDAEVLRPFVAKLRGAGIRVSLFLDYDTKDFSLAADCGAERVELYTEPYAVLHARGDTAIARRYGEATRRAADAGLGVNAGHDLNLTNLPDLLRAAPEIAEVSIGHALVADALEYGMAHAVRLYQLAIETAHA